MSSREKIIRKLKGRKRTFPGISKPEVYQPMVPVENRSKSALMLRFIKQSQLASSVIHQVKTTKEAVTTILGLIGEDKKISSWDSVHIPIPNLDEALDNAGIIRVDQDANVRVGLTGVDAALAATGSIVLKSGEGRFRAASLLTPVHIAVVTADQILPDLESWWGQQQNSGLNHIQQYSNIVVITGPSRTADIAMELVMGMHGPREHHLVIWS